MSSEKHTSINLSILLFVGISLFLFSYGRFCVSFATWIAPVFLIRFLRSSKAFPGLMILFVLISLASGIMLYGIVPPLLGVLTYILIVYYATLWFFPYLIDRLISPKFDGFISTLVFPISGVSIEFINNLILGSWASTAYTQFDNLALIQVSSILGIWGVSFMVMWFGPVVNWIIENKFEWQQIKTGVLIYSVTFSLILLYGGLRLEVFSPQSEAVTIASFTPTKATEKYYLEREEKGYSSSIEMAKKDRVTQSVLLKDVYDKVFEFNEELIGPEVKFTLWPEGYIQVLEEDETAFINQGKEWARGKNVYLLMAYYMIPKHNPERLGENKSVLINPKGELEWEYLKAHPVPGSADKAGDGILPISNTPFGKVSTAICYDMDFTALLNQAGKSDIDIMLVPAWDWKAINPLHARMAVFRAIENGFSMVRQTGDGLSISVDYLGRTVAAMDHFTTNDPRMLAKVPKTGVKTVYAIIGDIFAWMCVLSFCFIVIRSFFTRNFLPIK